MKTIKFLTILLCMIFVSCDSKVSESGDSKSITLDEAIQANDFETDHKLLAKFPSSSWDYEEAAKKIFNAETQFLAVQGTDEANKRLLLLINEKPIEGSDRAEGQELTKDCIRTGIEDVRHYDEQYSEYISWCQNYNSRCMQIFDIALALDNKQLAQMIIKAIKKDPGIESKLSTYENKLKKHGITLYNIYAHHTTQTKDEAIAKYEEHFGKLNDNAEEDFGNLSDNAEEN